jgi:hypothetical protein
LYCFHSETQEQYNSFVSVCQQIVGLIYKLVSKWYNFTKGGGDIESDAFAKRIINTFISGIVVYEDHSVIAYNITDETKEAESSSLLRLVNQTQVNSNSRLTLILPYALLWMKHKV